MIDRINLLLKAKNISARQFAEEIGIQPSGMSHILSGRNNPSLDFVMKVVKRWPEVNINWLVLGSGEMYAGMPLTARPAEKRSSEQKSSDEKVDQLDLFSQPAEVQSSPYSTMVQSHLGREEVEDSSVSLASRLSGDMPVADEHSGKSADAVQCRVQGIEQEEPPIPIVNQGNIVGDGGEVSDAVQFGCKRKKIEKIITVFSDHTFAEYYPE